MKVFCIFYLKQSEEVSADDVIQLGEEEDEEGAAGEGQHAADDLDPRLQAERAAAVTRLSAALTKLYKLRSDRGIFLHFMLDIYFHCIPDNYPIVQQENCYESWNKSK